jgi:hypothetical protein
VVIAVVGIVVAGAIALLTRVAGPPPAPVPAAWTPAYAERFEAACGASGSDGPTCRCLRIEMERRVPEDRMTGPGSGIGTGAGLAEADRAQLRQAAEACGG